MRLFKPVTFVVALLLLAAGPEPAADGAAALGARSSGTAFTLGGDSSYTYGCFPAPPHACAGPLFLASVFTGAFSAHSVGIDPQGFEIFEIDNVFLLAGAPGDLDVIMGSGVYRRQSGPDALQEMSLDLTVNGVRSAFHSGVVPVPDTMNAIDVSVSMNDLQNYDVLMHIAANPAKASTPSMLR